MKECVDIVGFTIVRNNRYWVLTVIGLEIWDKLFVIRHLGCESTGKMQHILEKDTILTSMRHQKYELKDLSQQFAGVGLCSEC